MYLFTRRTRLTSAEGLAWAASICPKVAEVTGTEVQLWGSVYGPGYGTITWTAWVPDLATLEGIGDKLQADAGYGELTAQGAGLTDGTMDDGLLQPLYGEPDPAANNTYVMGVQAVVAGGQSVRAMTAGVELAQTAESISGRSTMFMRGITGPYGGVGWLTGFENVSQIDAFSEALAADPSWAAKVDSTDGAFVEDPSITTSLIWRRLS